MTDFTIVSIAGLRPMNTKLLSKWNC